MSLDKNQNAAIQPLNKTQEESDSSIPGSQILPTQDQEKKKKRIKWILIGVGVTIAVVLAIVLPIVLTRSSGPEPYNPPPPGPLGDTIYNPYEIKRHVNKESSVEGLLFAKEDYQMEKHQAAYENILSFLDDSQPPQHNLTTLPKKFPIGLNNQFMKNLSYQFYMTDYKVAALVITDATSTRYSIPEKAALKPTMNPTMRLEMIGLKVFQADPFAFQFADIRDSSNVFVHTNDSTLVFLDKFIQMDFQLPSQRMYGLGERTREFPLGEGTWTMWASGKNNIYDDGLGGKGAYGVHPFLLIQSKKPGDYFGMYFRNSNAQSPIIRFNSTTGGATLSYITIGGQLEIFFFIHGSAKYIIQQYQYLIGTPHLPPIWSLGWHQASYAYNKIQDVKDMVAGYDKDGFPLDVVWLDIPYMDKFADFSVDTKAFPNLKEFITDLHDNSRYIVPILDAGISADKNSKYYTEASNKKALIKSSIYPDNGYNGDLISKVWPDRVAFMDWFTEDAYKVWSGGLQDLYEKLPYDGLWLDMNEPTTFKDGEYSDKELKDTVDQNSQQEFLSRVLRETIEDQSPDGYEDSDDKRVSWYKSFDNQNAKSTYFLPFIPGFNQSGNLDNMTLSLNGTHKQSGYSQYDVHSLYGDKMCNATYSFLRWDINSPHLGYRPFVLTRSTFAGSGRYAAHWTGDNFRDWAFLNYSIAGIMNFNMFGIQQTGSDVCGFFGNGPLDQDLCSRWIQLATFYPFSRIHYEKDADPSEPYRLTDSYKARAFASMHNRYQYVRLIYTCLYEASMWGTTCFDPLFFHYPEDDKAFQDTEHTFIVANAIKVSPILKPGLLENQQYTAYFPKGKWVSLVEDGVTVNSQGERKSIKAQLLVQAHQKPGSIIPFQDNRKNDIKKISQLQDKHITLLINRDEQNIAVGSVFLDSGIYSFEYMAGQYEYYTFTYQQKTIQKKLSGGTHATQNHQIDKVVIFNADDLSSTSFACYFTTDLDIVDLNHVYDTKLKALTLTFKDPIPYYKFRQINFGSATLQDLNLCDKKSYSYQLKGGDLPDLSGSSTTFEAVNQGGIAENLHFTLRIAGGNVVNVKWTIKKDGYTPFEVPVDIIEDVPTATTGRLSDYIQITDQPLQIKIYNGRKQLAATLSEFLLDDYFNYYYQQINTLKDDKFQGIMGLGERVSSDLFYDDGVYSIWNRDAGTPPDNGRPPGKNVYGTHPFFMYQNQAGSWVGVFNKLAQAQDWYIKNFKTAGTVDVTTVAAGGLGDLYYMFETSPNAVASSYLELVGKPVLIPQWALGWHQCKWGYETLDEVKEVVQNYKDSNLPLDGQWSDIDYMFNYRDFTYDPIKYANLSDFVTELHDQNMKWIPILDAGIAAREKGIYPSFDLGKDDDVFIKVQNDILIGNVWPNDAAYPDWFNPKAVTWWKTELKHFFNHLSFDGLWEDMNEASNFCSGYCYNDQKQQNPLQFQIKYTPTARYLEQQSIPLDGTHANGAKEIDTHSLFGTMQVKATHEFFQENKMRTFIIERSSFAGIGKFGSRWLGDQVSLPYYMGQSVTGSMMMNLFGIPLVGSDICGFVGDTDPELCARWYMVGAFQPFSRNHNDYGQMPQEPYRFNQVYEGNSTYTDIIRLAMRTKYCLLRYYYTQMFLIHKNGGSPIYKPLFFEYPDEVGAYDDYENNVMIGSALKVSVLANAINVNETEFYFPSGTWCNIFFPDSEKCFSSEGIKMKKRSKAYDFYAHLREGYIIPFQDGYTGDPKTVKDMQQKPVDFYINPQKTPWAEASWTAQGVYVNDDGENPNIQGNHNQYTLVAQKAVDAMSHNNKITIQILSDVATNYEWKDPEHKGCYGINMNDWLGQVVIFNATLSCGTKNFFGLAIYSNGTADTQSFIGQYDKDRDTLSMNFAGRYCLTQLSYIEMTET